MGGRPRQKPVASHRLTDAWILHAVVMSGRSDGATLRSLLGVADFLNHAVPTYDELAGALARLAAGGWITHTDARFHGSARSHELADGVNLGEQRVRLQDALLAADSPLAAPPLFLDRETYQLAVNEYLDRM